MSADKMPVKVFLKNFALNQFSNQKGEMFKEENFDIRTIEPKQGFELGYEITSLVSSSSFLLQMHLNIDRSDVLSPFVLKTNNPLLDTIGIVEVFEATGAIDSAHHLNDGYYLSDLLYDVTKSPALLDVDRMPFTLVDGGLIFIS